MKSRRIIGFSRRNCPQYFLLRVLWSTGGDGLGEGGGVVGWLLGGKPVRAISSTTISVDCAVVLQNLRKKLSRVTTPDHAISSAINNPIMVSLT